jgi:hypothetical protein
LLTGGVTVSAKSLAYQVLHCAATEIVCMSVLALALG